MKSAFAPIADTSITLTPRVAFESHPFVNAAPGTLARPVAGELMLWLFRSEWQLISKEVGHARLSRAELRRVRHYPSSALSKRYAVGRAVLRGVLAAMTGAAPHTLELIDTPYERVRLAGDAGLNGQDDASPLDIVVDYAGIWIVIGIANCPLGIGTQVPRGADPARRAARANVRRISLSQALGSAPGLDMAAFEHNGPAFIVDTPSAGAWHLVDIPMPGMMYCTVSAGRPVTRVRAFGWHPMLTRY